MRIEELKDILASRSGVYGANIALSDMYGVLEDYDALCAELAERDEQHRRIMAEECAPDERHCTCVPALRAEVARLRNELDEIRLAYTDIMNEPCEDEVHCTCVPGLRAEIVKWIAANNAATTIINEQQAEIECLRRMIQR